MRHTIWEFRGEMSQKLQRYIHNSGGYVYGWRTAYRYMRDKDIRMSSVSLIPQLSQKYGLPEKYVYGIKSRRVSNDYKSLELIPADLIAEMASLYNNNVGVQYVTYSARYGYRAHAINRVK